MNKLLILCGIFLSSLNFANTILNCASSVSSKNYHIVVSTQSAKKLATVYQSGNQIARYDVVSTQESDRIEFLDKETDGGNFTLRVAIGNGPLAETMPGLFMAQTSLGLVGSDIVCVFQ